jgi:formylglycine-generating enzyme required for sulfatase activity
VPVDPRLAGASSYGALDIPGNVYEWVARWYGGDYYANSPDSKPREPESGTFKVLRGGSWFEEWNIVRAAYRGFSYPDNSDGIKDIGLRCVASPEE